MNDIDILQEKITLLGQKLINCSKNCEGIQMDVKNGILPRCLIYEHKNRNFRSRGCIIVGINPGISKPKERKFYIDKGIEYQNLIFFWEQILFKIRYHKFLRNLVGELGFQGPILWTELVKCENKIPGKLPPIQTFRNCMKNFLSEELKIVPPGWPIIAVSKRVFTALAYCYPEHVVIGVPHPTGSRGHFSRLFDENGHLLNKYQIKYEEIWDGVSGKAFWLTK